MLSAVDGLQNTLHPALLCLAALSAFLFSLFSIPTHLKIDICVYEMLTRGKGPGLAGDRPAVAVCVSCGCESPDVRGGRYVINSM